MTRPPRRGYAALVVGSCAVMLSCAGVVAVAWHMSGYAWFLAADGTLAAQDFIAYRVAGLLALDGRAAGAYRPDVFSEVLAELMHRRVPHWLGWPYPPVFILYITPLALLPYAVAWWVWLAVTAGMLLALLLAAPGLRRHAFLVFAAPAAFICLLKGQNGFLSAALLTGTLLLMDRRPWLAGLCLGLLTFKPHFGLVLPVLLLATRRWTVIAGAAATALLLGVATAMAYGIGIWPDFVASASGATQEWMRPEVNLYAMQTVYAFAAMRLPPAYAAALHVVSALAALGIALRLWLTGTAPGVRNAAAIAATLLVTPYAHHHDLVMLGVAGAFLLGQATEAEWRRDCGPVVVALLLPALTVFPWSGLQAPGPVAAWILLLLALRRARATAA